MTEKEAQKLAAEFTQSANPRTVEFDFADIMEIAQLIASKRYLAAAIKFMELVRAWKAKRSA